MLYLLCADRPLMRGSTPVRHYLGYCLPERFIQRMDRHRHGRGARLTRALFLLPDQKVYVTRLWMHGDQTMERQLKNRRKLAALCPRCREAHLALRRERESLSHRALRSKNVIVRLETVNGGAWLAISPTGPSTWSPPVPLPANGTGSAGDTALSAPTPGGGGTSVAAPHRPAGATWRAGTSAPVISSWRSLARGVVLARSKRRL
jgi:hypothetical protein